MSGKRSMREMDKSKRLPGFRLGQTAVLFQGQEHGGGVCVALKFSFGCVEFKMSERKHQLGFVGLGSWICGSRAKMMAGSLQFNVLLATQDQYISIQACYLSPNQLQYLCPFPVQHHCAGSEAISVSSCQALQGLVTCLAFVRG